MVTRSFSDSYDAMFVLCVNGIGGAELSLLTVANGLAQKGLHVGLILYGSHPELLIPRACCTVHILPAKRTVHAFFPLWKLLYTLKPACVISAFPHTNIMTLFAAKLASNVISIILTEHCSFVAPAPHNTALIRLLARFLYPHANGVVAVSHGLKAELHTIAPRAKTHVIYNPIIEDTASPDATAPHAWLAGDIPVIIAVGRLAPQKAFHDLLDGFALLLKRHPARLIILGEGSERAALAAQANILGISEHVCLAGFVDDVRPWLKHARLFVSSSHYEGLGNVIVEALHAGLKVIATDCPVGPAEILGNGRWGTLVPVADIHALAHAMEQGLLAQHDPKPAHMRAQDFTYAKAVDAYAALLAAV